jgi:glycosyltransferase involved in cell wall biosynthesis
MEKGIHSLHIIGSAGLGGAESFYCRLVNGLHDRGMRVAAVTRPNSPIASGLCPNIPKHGVGLRNNFDMLSSFAIRRLVRELAPGFVQTYMGRATRLTRLAPPDECLHIARLGGYYKIGGYYEHARAWVVNTKGLRDYVIGHGLSAERVYYIGNFVEEAGAIEAGELEKLRKSLGVPKGAYIIFSLGRFVEKKGFQDLLSAFSLMAKEIHERPVYLVVAGDGPLREKLCDQARQLGIAKRIRWAGWIKEPGPYFQMADLFVCPSRHEPLGNVILEAWANRLAVVSTETKGGAELIEDGINGVLTPASTPNKLVNTIERVLAASPAERSCLAENGFQKLRRKHSKKAIEEAYLDMYDELERLGPARKPRSVYAP